MDTKIYLIIGTCGTGKTWLMKQLIKELGISNIYSYKTGLYQYLKQKDIMILGKYDGSIFEGSDRLSMSIMSDNEKIKPIMQTVKFVIAEGDRFTNQTFISTFAPIIIKINGNGSEGREKRGSSQTERQIKSITTRVTNIKADLEFDNSSECLTYILKQIKQI